MMRRLILATFAASAFIGSALFLLARIGGVL